MSTFNPQDHMTNMKGKDYLEVKWRLVWFKETNPKGSILTEVINQVPALVKATIVIDSTIVSTGHGSATSKGNSVWSGREIEKAETAAIGRALAHAGYGTQFTEEVEEELADSPVEKSVKVQPQKPTATTPERTELVKEFSLCFNQLSNESKSKSLTIKGNSTIEEIEKALRHNQTLLENQK